MVAQARTQSELARVETKRYTTLAPSGVVSQQEVEEHQATLDTQRANVMAAEASLASAEANVHRLEQLKGFATVTAPFDGVITSRTTETGQLVTAGQGAGQALFKVAEVDGMRVYVNVPQTYATSIHVGDSAKVRVRDVARPEVVGTITRTSNELDSVTRTLLTEVRVPNADRALISGMYAQVVVRTKRVGTALLIPSSALVIDAQGTRVAIVAGDRVHWQLVQVDSDTGDKIAIVGGLRETDAVVERASSALREGMTVRPQP